MFGYVTIYRKDLSENALDRYQAYYCGLCRALGQRYGVTGRMALSFDMTFVAILLSALYDTPTEFSRGRCAAHPVKSRPRADNPYIHYAADMTVALAYYNYMDDWQDDKRRASLFAAQKLERYLTDIRGRWPRQCEAMRTGLAQLNALEAAQSTDLDALCNCFGGLLGAVFQYQEDIWAPVLDRMGRGLGGFIYLMDAYDDLEKDKKRGSFNALADTAAHLQGADYEARCHALLTQQMALCAQPYKLLPVLANTPEGQLLNNTLYSGVWCRYSMLKLQREQKYNKKRKKEGASE